MLDRAFGAKNWCMVPFPPLFDFGFSTGPDEAARLELELRRLRFPAGAVAVAVGGLG